MKSILSQFNRSPKNENYMKRITPEWITSLKENEIFVFGCRNSGRHFDGASCFALEHFGAIMGSVKAVKVSHTRFRQLVVPSIRRKYGSLWQDSRNMLQNIRN